MDIARLAAMPWYTRLAPCHVDVVSTFATESSFTAGDALFEKGDFSSHMYAVESGQAAVYDGERLLRTLGPGDFVGVDGALYGRRRAITVRAVSSLLVLVLHASDLRRLRRQPGGERLTGELASMAKDAVGSPERIAGS